MRELIKTGVLIFVLGLLSMAAACTRSPEAVPPTSLPASAEPSRTAPVSPTQNDQTTAATETLTPSPVPENLLDAATTFEVVAAVHGNMLQIADWLPQGLSVFERRAIVQPIAEISMAPLEAIFTGYLPSPDLAESWHQAAEIHRSFYPQLMSWVNGDLDDNDFTEVLAGLLNRSDSVIAHAEQIVGQLGLEPPQYGPDYALARDVVFRLLPGIAGQGMGVDTADSFETDRQENPKLVVRQLNPFTYPFAGMDVFLVVGLVENTSLIAQQGVEVEILFYNILGEHLGTMVGRLLVQTALPGGVYPFSASVVKEGEEAALKDWTDFQAIVFSHPVSDEGVSYQDFELSVSSASRKSDGKTVIEGTLTNVGSEMVLAANIRIGVMAFDLDGTLVGVGNGSVSSGGSLMPGQSMPVWAVIEALSAEPARYQFYAEVSQ
jgi:hypothetical protein